MERPRSLTWEWGVSQARGADNTHEQQKKCVKHGALREGQNIPCARVQVYETRGDEQLVARGIASRRRDMRRGMRAQGARCGMQMNIAHATAECARAIIRANSIHGASAMFRNTQAARGAAMLVTVSTCNVHGVAYNT
eukprot:5278955-Pleurochrysis_carterae.AAC.2